MTARPDLRAWVRERWPLLVLAAIFLLAVVVRAVDVVDNPRGFFTDEASFGLNADLILHTGRDEHGALLPLLFRSFGEYKLPVFIYAELPFMAIFGRGEEAVRYTSVLLGSLTVLTTYLLARELFRRELPALAAAACLAILPWHVHYSRTGLGDIVSWPLFFTLAAYLFLRGTRDPRFLIPAAVAFGACFYTYRASWVTLPPLLLILAVAYRRELWRHRWIVAYGALAGLLMLLPLAYHLLSGTDDRSSQAWIFDVTRGRGVVSVFWEFYRSYFGLSFLFENGDNGPIVRHYLPGQGELYWAQLPLLLAGVVALLRRFDRVSLLLLSLLFIYPLSGALSNSSPISSRSILGSVTFALISGYGLWALIELLSQLRPHWRRLIAAGAVTASVLAGGFSYAAYAEHYFSDYPKLSAGFWGWQDGPQQIIAHFLEVQDDYDELIMDGDFNSPAIFIPFYAGNACYKCKKGGTNHYSPRLKQLFALRPENISVIKYRFNILGEVSYPDGRPAFLFLEITGER